MIKVQFLFPSAMSDAEARDICDAHVVEPARQSPGLLSISRSDGPLMGMRDAPYRLVVEAAFDSLDSAMIAARSEPAQAGEARMKEHGVVLMMYEVEQLHPGSDEPAGVPTRR